ncbi:hypothetical protein [Stenomitos frigidus]|uniref:Uncharacterized protein n=1 Tax=Stenomitos frigidus AS-A4 TaxID=2933935 RepID=A0ABV0KRZ6_9CYAN
MMNTRRNLIKGAVMTTTGSVFGAMSSFKLQKATAQQPVAQASERSQTSSSRLLAARLLS